ncbi:MAG: hypothetical protein ACRD3T_22465 [Terriglobia bacterium]
MSKNAAVSDIERAYEAVRAQATGEVVAITPRGLALLLSAGVPDWIRTCAPLKSAAPTTVPLEPRAPLSSLCGELVAVLTEMALSNQRKCYA